MLTILQYLTKSREDQFRDLSTGIEECTKIVQQILILYSLSGWNAMFRCPGWLTEATPLHSTPLHSTLHISTSNHHQLNNFMPLAICATERGTFQLLSTPLHSCPCPAPLVRARALPSEHQRICSGQWCRMSHKCKTNAHGDNEYFC